MTESSQEAPHSSSLTRVYTKSDDDRTVGFGSSPMSGDHAASRLLVPVAPTPAHQPNRRYLFRLCTLPVVCGAIIERIFQKVAIGYVSADGSWWREMNVVSPDWHFLDGNVSWHLRLLPGQGKTTRTGPSSRILQGRSRSDDINGTGPALLYGQDLANYLALNGGEPPGVAIGDYGTFYSLMGSWDRGVKLGIEVPGDGIVGLYASVKQTDPTKRVIPAVGGMPVAAFDPEDRFVDANPLAVYRAIAGGIVLL